jgi:predicted outer membrane protein
MYGEVKRMRMKRSGRVSLVLIAALAIVAAVVALFMLAGDSPSGVAGRFLSALAKGDTKTLAELSYMEGLSQSEIESKWKATHDSSKYWVFAYAIKDVKEQDANNATVNLDWVKDIAGVSPEEGKAELPMVKREGKWLVDVRAISRNLYPFLPQ